MLCRDILAMTAAGVYRKGRLRDRQIGTIPASLCAKNLRYSFLLLLLNPKSFQMRIRVRSWPQGSCVPSYFTPKMDDPGYSQLSPKPYGYNETML